MGFRKIGKGSVFCVVTAVLLSALVFAGCPGYAGGGDDRTITGGVEPMPPGYMLHVRDCRCKWFGLGDENNCMRTARLRREFEPLPRRYYLQPPRVPLGGFADHGLCAERENLIVQDWTNMYDTIHNILDIDYADVIRYYLGTYGEGFAAVVVWPDGPPPIPSRLRTIRIADMTFEVGHIRYSVTIWNPGDGRLETGNFFCVEYAYLTGLLSRDDVFEIMMRPIYRRP